MIDKQVLQFILCLSSAWILIAEGVIVEGEGVIVVGEGVIVEGEGSLRGRGSLLWDEAGVTEENVAIKQLSLENRFRYVECF